MTVKEQLFAKIEELETLLLEASCDDKQLAEDDDVFAEMMSTLRRFADEVDYYVD